MLGKPREFSSLVAAYDFLAGQLDTASNVEDRIALLQQMKLLIEEFDNMVFAQEVPLRSLREKNSPRRLMQVLARYR